MEICRLAFTVGIIPSLNVAAGLLGFVGLKSLTVGLQKLGWPGRPFTQQVDALAALGANVAKLDVLRASAAAGVPNPSQLAARLRPLVDTIVASVRAKRAA